MTNAQINKVLSDIGESANEWTSLSAVGIILLENDPKIYVNPRTYRFKFNTSSGFLEFATGYIDNEGKFKTYSGYDEDNLVADGYYDLSTIGGLILTEAMHFTYIDSIQFR